MSSTQKYTAPGLVSSLVHSRPTAEGKRATINNKHEDNKLKRKVKLLEKRHKEKLHFIDIRRQHFEREHEEHLPPLVCVSSPLMGRHAQVKPKITCNGRIISKLQETRNATSLPDIADSVRNQKKRIEQRLRTRSCESLKTSPPEKDDFFISDLYHLSPPHWDYEKLIDVENGNNNTQFKRHGELEPIDPGKKIGNGSVRARSLSHVGLNSSEKSYTSKPRSLSAEIPRSLPHNSPLRTRKKSL